MLAERFPGLHVTCSHEVWPQIREYERTMVAILSAYVRPRVERYLGQLERELAGVGRAGAALHHEVERRRDDRARRPPGHRRDDAVGPGLRRHRGDLRLRPGRLPEPDHVRHGRHQRRHRAGARRPAGVLDRRDGGRLPDRHAGRRRLVDRGGRRLDRLARPRRRPEGRPAERGRRSRAGLLRPRRHRAGALRRLPAVRLPQPRQLRRRPAPAPPRPGGRGAAPARRGARPRRGRDRRGGGRGRHREHVRGVLQRAGAPRARPARLRPGRLRRRRPRRGLLPGRGVPHPARHRAAVPGHALRPGRDDRRRQERLRQDAPPPAVGDVRASCSPPSARSCPRAPARWLAEEAPAVVGERARLQRRPPLRGPGVPDRGADRPGLARGRHHRPAAGGVPRSPRSALRARRPRGRRRADRPARHDHRRATPKPELRAVPTGHGPGDAGRPPPDPLPEAAPRRRRVPPARPPGRPAPRRAGGRRAGRHDHAGAGRLPRHPSTRSATSSSRAR